MTISEVSDGANEDIAAGTPINHATELVDRSVNLISAERVIVFVGVVREGRLDCAMQTRDFPREDLNTAADRFQDCVGQLLG